MIEDPSLDQPTKVLVCGGRTFNDRAWVVRRLSSLRPGTIIIHGDAPGADRLVEEVSRELKLETRAYPADWDHYGPAAGPIRNRQMLEEEHPDLVIAFPGGKGTYDMCKQARGAGVEVQVAMNEEQQRYMRQRLSSWWVKDSHGSTEGDLEPMP
jgi:hypothetical protein